MTYRLQVKDHFDAAHFIRDYSGKCSRVHGHRWDVEVCIQGRDLDAINMLVDFSVVKRWFKEILESLDHYLLNQQLSEPNVTAELLAKLLFDRFDERVRKYDETGNLFLVRMCIWESPDCCVKYSPNMLSIVGAKTELVRWQ